MKIAIFSDTFPPQTNGVANVVFKLSQNLARLGHRVAVFTVLKNKQNHVVKDIAGVSVFALSSVPVFIYSGERMALPSRSFLNDLKRFSPDIIHTHTPMIVGLKASLAAKKLKVPLVGTHHTFYDHYLKHIFLDYNWAKQLSWKLTVSYYNGCQLVVNPTQALTDTMFSYGLKTKTVVVPNSIDTVFFSPAQNEQEKREAKNKLDVDGLSICYMGRISYEKSVDQVVKSFALASKVRPDMQLMLIGDGPDRKKIERLARQLGIANKVVFTGFLFGDNLVQALRANDLYLTASKSENMPLSVLEAMATAMPIIAVKEKGLSEIVKNDINGLFAKTDDPQDMAKKILAVISDPKKLKDMSFASRALALKHSYETITKEMEKLYYQTIKDFKK